jgi:predicted dehydrogenase
VKTAVIVGCGSIGIRHLKYLLPIVEKIIVIDPKNVIEALPEGGIKHFQSAEEISIMEGDENIGVVSNWGPDHLDTVKILISKGIRKIVLEKPMVCSIEELEELADFVHRFGVSIVVNQGWHYVSLAERINNLGASFKIEQAVALFAWGGARCHSTFGSHLIHLANSIFRSTPNEICAMLIDSKINPRGASLAYLEGSVTVRYESGALLALNFTNSSSVAGKVNIVWKEADATLIEEEIKVMRRSKQRDFADTITRYGDSDQDLFQGIVPWGPLNEVSQLEGLYASLIEKTYQELSVEFKDHVTSSRVLLMALISSYTGKTVRFSDELSEDLRKKLFRIS